jgi:hypothetical protein
MSINHIKGIVLVGALCAIASVWADEASNSPALAVIDTESRTKVADIPLKAHPEGSQFEAGTQDIFVIVSDVDAKRNRASGTTPAAVWVLRPAATTGARP